jgi:hypothetical protein
MESEDSGIPGLSADKSDDTRRLWKEVQARVRAICPLWTKMFDRMPRLSEIVAERCLDWSGRHLKPIMQGQR